MVRVLMAVLGTLWLAGCTQPSLTQRTEFARRMTGTYVTPPNPGSWIVGVVEHPAMEPGSTVRISVEPDGTFTAENGSDPAQSMTIKYRWTKEGVLTRGRWQQADPGVAIFLGPAIPWVKETVRRTEAGLSIRSVYTERGLLFFIIPWKDNTVVTQTNLARFDVDDHPG